MKANEAPEKIYINPNLENRTWLIGKGDTSFIEYTRTDAFIEKACAFMHQRLIFDDKAWYTNGQPTIKDKVIEDFKNYMKGE